MNRGMRRRWQTFFEIRDVWNDDDDDVGIIFIPSPWSSIP
jgi:hypothetical protein